MADPKCPECGATGTEHIVSKDSDEQSKGGDPWFNIVHCDKCGHVYGVFAKVVRSPSMKLPNMPKL
jgi:uncharacterized Zn finger protein